MSATTERRALDTALDRATGLPDRRSLAQRLLDVWFLIFLPTLLVLFIGVALGWLGPELDNHSGEALQADVLAEAQKQAQRLKRFEQAAQQVCGPQGTVELLQDGTTVQCRDKRGIKTITAQVPL